MLNTKGSLINVSLFDSLQGLDNSTLKIVNAKITEIIEMSKNQIGKM